MPRALWIWIWFVGGSELKTEVFLLIDSTRSRAKLLRNETYTLMREVATQEGAGNDDGRPEWLYVVIMEKLECYVHSSIQS